MFKLIAGATGISSLLVLPELRDAGRRTQVQVFRIGHFPFKRSFVLQGSKSWCMFSISFFSKDILLGISLDSGLGYCNTCDDIHDVYCLRFGFFFFTFAITWVK